jgi:hypothetical protein
MSAASQQPIRLLPDSPSLNSLKGQAKQLLSRQRKGDADSCVRFTVSHPDWSDGSETDVQSATLSLADAQLVVAREYGFESWPKLKHHVEEAVPRTQGVLSELPDRMIDDHLSSLERRHRTFADLLRRTLIFHGFSKDTSVMVSMERSTFGALVASLPSPCCVYTFFADQEVHGELTGQRGPVVLDMTRPISGALLDGVTSGSVRIPSGDDDEARSLMTPIVVTMMAHFERVWRLQPSLKATDAELETEPSYVSFVDHREGKSDRPLNVPKEEPVITARFEIVSDEVSGPIRLSYLNRTLQNIVVPRRFAKGKAQHFKTVLEGPDRRKVKSLFESHTRGKVEIDSVLDDQAYGMVVVDDVKGPTVAQVTLYDESSTFSTNTWYAGDIDHPILADWIAHPPTGVVPESAEWEQRLIEHRGLPSRRSPCVEFDASGLDLQHLEKIASQIPEEVRLERVDLELAERIQDGYWPSIANNFASLADFVERGVAYCALVQEDPALVALTNIVSDRGVRLLYKVNPEHASEQQSLAAVASAQLAHTCLSEGRQVEWWTMPNARRENWLAQVAVRLGFVAKEPYEMLVWDGEANVK